MTNLCEHGNFATQLPLSTGIAFTRGNACAFSIFRFCYHLQLCTAGDPLNSFNPLDWTSPAFDSSSLMSITWNTLHVAWHRYPPPPFVVWSWWCTRSDTCFTCVCFTRIQWQFYRCVSVRRLDRCTRAFSSPCFVSTLAELRSWSSPHLYACSGALRRLNWHSDLGLDSTLP